MTTKNRKLFKHLCIPDHWRHYWTRYPEGYTILEALISWTTQVNDMVDQLNKNTISIEEFKEEVNKQLADFLDRFQDNLSEEVVRELTEWLDSGLLADIINKDVFDMKADTEWVENELNKTTYYDKYTITKNYDPVSETEYWITEIVTDSETPLYFDVTEGGKGQTVREYATEHNTTISINGGTMETDSAGNIVPSGVTIINGEVITDKPSSFQWKVGLTYDNKLVFFSPEKTSQEIFNEEPNIKDVLTAFTPLIIDGEAASPDILSDGINYDERHPRQVIGQKANGNMLFFTTGGRGYGGQGMLASDCIRILQNIGCEKAFMLDGGGSTSLVEKGVFLNYRIDNLGTSERRRPTVINLGADKGRPYMNDIRDLFSRVSNIEAKLYTFESPQLVSDLDTINVGGFYWALRTANGVPNDGENSWAVIHFQLGPDKFQIAFPYRTAITLEGYMFIRRTFGNTWSGWRNTTEIRHIPNLKEDTPYKDLPTGRFHNWVSSDDPWLIDGEERWGFLITEKAYGYEHRSCIQTFYESKGYNVYYRKPNTETEWSRWFKYTGEIT